MCISSVFQKCVLKVLSKEGDNKKEVNDRKNESEERLVNSKLFLQKSLRPVPELLICCSKFGDAAYVDALAPRLGVGLEVVVPIFEAPL